MRAWHDWLGACLCLAMGLPVPAAAPRQSDQSIAQKSQSPLPDNPASAGLDAQHELQTGSRLTRQGSLEEAIPHLLAAQRAGADPYSTAVNLGICYVGTGRYKEAIAVLEPLRTSGSRASVADNLLAQSYLGDGQTRSAFRVFLEAADRTPKDEKLYAFMADACTDHHAYSLGLQVVDRGLQSLPDSARLHYERALFLARLGRFEEGRPEFERAAQLAPASYIAYLALVQKDLYEDDLSGATRLLHQAIAAGNRDYQMLSLLGTVLLHEGAAPGQPAFAEAQTVLEESAKDRPDYSATQIALGKVYLMLDRDRDAIEHLEIGRRLEPDNPAVYASLADAWGRLGDREKARAMRAQIGRLLAEKNAKTTASSP
jgi:tetratricopeptide (TPR) repeat protein